MNAWIRQQLVSSHRIAIPIMTHPGIEMTKHKVGDAVRNGSIHAEAILKLNEAFPIAASTMIMDLTLEAEAFGCKIEFHEDEMPQITGRLVSNRAEIDNLKIPGLYDGRIQEYLKANRWTVEHITDKPVFAGAIGPFSLAGRLFGVSDLMISCYMEPDPVSTLLDKCTRFILSYCKELKTIGCHGVVIAEPAAGLLSNDDCDNFSSRYIRHLVEELQDEHFLVILHNCGNHGHCTRAMINTGANALHFGNAIDMADALQNCPEDKLVLGNVDPVGVMKLLPASNVKNFVGDLLRKTAKYKNFILSTGCDLPPHVPIANIDAFFDGLREFNETLTPGN